MKKLLNRLLITLNVLIIVAMLVTGNADILNPQKWGWFSMGGYAFPFLVIANLAMMALWIFIRLRNVIIPFAGMVLCYSPVSKICPLNLSEEAPKGSLKVISYNVWYWGGSYSSQKNISDDEARKQIMQYIGSQDADIVALQEAGYSKYVAKDLSEYLPQYPYIDTTSIENYSCIMVLSRYPIAGKERIYYPSRANLSGAFTIDVDGKKVNLVVNHLETNSFSPEEKEVFSSVVHGEQDNEMLTKESKFLLNKLTHAAKRRAPQAEAVAEYVARHKDKPLILCGDFNDIPISYTHRTIAEDLNDCYVSTAFGPSFSYNRSYMHVRIDNMMCSDKLTPYNCHIDKSISLSDHYPIICQFTFAD